VHGEPSDPRDRRDQDRALSHPFIEHLVGTMRREFLDHVSFWNGCDLEQKLDDFQFATTARCHARENDDRSASLFA
jgi:hypothetical protein